MAEQLFTNEVDAAQAKRDNATSDARAQAAEFNGFVAAEVYTAPDGTKFEVPNLGLLDDDQEERFNELQVEFQKCDRVPDIEIPERTVEDPDGNKTTYPARTVKGLGLITPYQKDGKLISPSYNVQLTTALLGEDGYAKFKAAKGKSSQFASMVMKLANELAAREGRDPKSEDSSGDVAAVSN